MGLMHPTDGTLLLRPSAHPPVSVHTQANLVVRHSRHGERAVVLRANAQVHLVGRLRKGVDGSGGVRSELVLLMLQVVGVRSSLLLLVLLGKVNLERVRSRVDAGSARRRAVRSGDVIGRKLRWGSRRAGMLLQARGGGRHRGVGRGGRGAVTVTTGGLTRRVPAAVLAEVDLEALVLLAPADGLDGFNGVGDVGEVNERAGFLAESVDELDLAVLGEV